MEGKPKKKWMKAKVADKKEIATKPDESKKPKEHSRVKAMYGNKKGRYYG